MSNNLVSPNLMAPPTLLPNPCAYIISYEINLHSGFNYSPLFEELQSSINWFHYMTNTWVVLRRETLVGFNNILLTKIHSQDKLLIMPAKGPAMGWLPNDAWVWLNTNLKREW